MEAEKDAPPGAFTALEGTLNVIAMPGKLPAIDPASFQPPRAASADLDAHNAEMLKVMTDAFAPIMGAAGGYGTAVAPKGGACACPPLRRSQPPFVCPAEPCFHVAAVSTQLTATY